MDGWIYTLLIGAVSGWLAGQIKQGFGFGLIGNIIIGIIGSFVGNWLFSTLNITLGSGMISTVATSVIGALAVLFLVSLVKK